VIKVEAFFDCSCVWVYLAFAHAERLRSIADCELRWRPVLARELFAAISPAAGRSGSAAVHKQADRDLLAWSRYLQRPLFHNNLSSLKTDSDTCMLACVAAGRWNRMDFFAQACLEAAWAKGRDVADRGVLRNLWEEAGLPGAAFDDAVDWPETRDELASNSRELLSRGGFGIPTFFVGDNMYFGNDALPLVHRAVTLKGKSNARAGLTSKRREAATGQSPLRSLGG